MAENLGQDGHIVLTQVGFQKFPAGRPKFRASPTTFKPGTKSSAYNQKRRRRTESSRREIP